MHRTILDTIGSPLVALQSTGTTIAAKLESFNPGGSAKIRPALAMVQAAEANGLLEPGDRIVEPTSGNTGIGLAVVCAVRDYQLTLVMPASKSTERRQIMRAYGADIELVEGEISEARQRAKTLAEEGAVYLNQFTNPANPDSHYHGTGKEILDQIEDQPVDAFVAGVGTGGTLTGVGRRLRERFPDVDIVAVEPAANAVLSGCDPGDDDYQGMGPGFISENLDRSLIDTVETVPVADANAECRRLAREHGILVGQSSGAVSLVCHKIAPQYDDGLVVTVFWDSGERYLSGNLFE